MSNILTANVSIKGVRPLLWHVFTEKAMPLEKKEKRGVAGRDPDEWRDTSLATKEGQLYIRHDYIFGALKESAKYTKRGRGSIQKYVAATLQVSPDKILLNRHFPGYPNGQEFDWYNVDPPDTDDDLPVYLDIRGSINPSTKGRNVKYRIASNPGWEAQFTLQWDATVVSRQEMEAVTIDAGRLVGVASGRPIGMGRFEVISFDIE